ncbi:hypothetical protein NADFUDRAFT_47867 [Nadsonia fulvescens var. elongata DSM 6958]|uniref:Cytokinin riboside 5'-monophosphate phosphoribohydrolase n=1 Tax=Nadsonia fulvescens var. elongata DSM 6958 TaxID=857566 RepID=A0A1E3PDH2_9ASCO|nr:hypothetical protein NADFUDRAFT_47867 [Nadsonia fulvescens var. elongata DSM 6958]
MTASISTAATTDLASIAPVKKVCVFCGASSGNKDVFTESAVELGQVLAKNNWGLVYGGGTTGLMGSLASSVMASGGQAHGIIPRALISREQKDATPDAALYGKTTIVDDMHTRKRMMGQEADAFVALPGGYGTAEELFEVVTWNQLGIHGCPIVVLNIDGFYDGLLSWIDTAVDRGFIPLGTRDIVVEATSPEQIVEKINNYRVANNRFNLKWEQN